MPTPPLPEDVLAETLAAWRAHDCRIDLAANAVGVPYRTFQSRLNRARAHPALLGDGQRAGYNSEAVSHYWIKTPPKDDQPGISAFVKVDRAAETLADFAAGLHIEAAPPVPPPPPQRTSLATVYTLTDCHIGMLAWHKEGGANWGIPEARKIIGGAFDALLSQAPPADIGIVAVLGDWLHYDGFEPVTPESRHVLSSDTRFPKLAEVAASMMRRVIDAALAKHPRVVLVCAEGNHDQGSSVWLRVMMSALYEREPRLRILPDRLPFYCYQHGETMLAWHHGHKVKPAALPLLIAQQFREIWGATRQTYIHTGHMHHVEEKEHSGAIVLQHPTLAARDAYAARHGWHALRRAMAITYHDCHGEVGRVYVTPEMIA